MKIRNNFSKKERRMKFKYSDFIDSDWWKKQKEDYYSRHKKKCAKCKSNKNLQLHHKYYPNNKRFLSLPDNAFVVLCKECHFSFHKFFGVKQYMGKESLIFIKNMKKFNFSIEDLKERYKENKDKPQPRNNLEDIKEQIWEIVKSKNPKANRKMFFIKTSGISAGDLIAFKKWALSTDNFCRAFYGALKSYHIKNNHEPRKKKTDC